MASSHENVGNAIPKMNTLYYTDLHSSFYTASPSGDIVNGKEYHKKRNFHIMPVAN